MKKEDLKKLHSLISMLCRNYKNDFDEGLIHDWFLFFEDYEINQIEAAVKTHIMESKFFPSISEILNKLKPDIKIEAAEAWGILKQRLCGSTAGNNPITQQIARTMGGARWLAQMNLDDLERKRKEFIDLYLEYSAEEQFEKNKQINSDNSNLIIHNDENCND